MAACDARPRLLEASVSLPVVNENDTVATEEIRYGDNDRLAARVALMAGVDHLVLLSDVDGLYTANPRRDPAARRIETVSEITPEIEAMGDAEGGESGSGGMRTKLLAAKTAVSGGCAMAIAKGAPDGATPHRPILSLRRGAPCTWFLASKSPRAARKQWIAGMKPMGALVIDAGAADALRAGKSLLPAGVVSVSGRFQRGDPVTIETEDGQALGAALSAYPVDEARRICGAQSSAVADILGHPGRAAMAHRDDMALWD